MINESIKKNIEKFANNINTTELTEFIKAYADIGDSEVWGGKYCGSDAEKAGAEFIADTMKKIGVPKVEIVETDTNKYQFNDATLTVKGEDLAIKPFGYVSPGTEKNGFAAELFDAEKADKDFLDGKDISGKIFLIESMGVLDGTSLSAQMEEAVIHGASALLMYMTEDILDD
jgi:hypothetical protein